MRNSRTPAQGLPVLRLPLGTAVVAVHVLLAALLWHGAPRAPRVAEPQRAVPSPLSTLWSVVTVTLVAPEPPPPPRAALGAVHPAAPHIALEPRSGPPALPALHPTPAPTRLEPPAAPAAPPLQEAQGEWPSPAPAAPAPLAVAAALATSPAVPPPSAPAPAPLATRPPTPASPPAAGPAITLAQADHRHCPPAPHPRALRDRGIEGAVRIAVRVSAEGAPADVRLVDSSGWRLFDEAALAQVRGCRFVPARHDGEAVESWVQFRVRFALGEPAGEFAPVALKHFEGARP